MYNSSMFRKKKTVDDDCGDDCSLDCSLLEAFCSEKIICEINWKT